MPEIVETVLYIIVIAPIAAMWIGMAVAMFKDIIKDC